LSAHTRHALVALLFSFAAACGGGEGEPAPAERVPDALQLLRVATGPVPAVRAKPPIPWGRVLGAADDLVVRHTADGETRWARCLSVGTGLEGRVRLPAPDSVLVFDYTVSRRMPGKPANPRLSVLIESATIEERVEIVMGEPDVWHPARVNLIAGAGTTVTVRIEAVVEGEGTFYVALAGATVVAMDPDAPAVVLVTSDTHRADHVGVARLGVDVRTPAIDALATRGTWFADCFAPSHVTLPSHAALFTGASPRDTGVLDNNTTLSAAAPTLAEAFRDAGWLTCAATSLDLLADAHSGFGQGFERVSAPEGTRVAGETVAVATRWLDEAEGRPVFLWVHVADAHAPYAPPTPFDQLYYPAGRDAFDPALEPSGEPPRWMPLVRDPEYVRALYRGEVSYLDTELARLFEHRRAASGVVALTADHGESLGQHDIWWRHKDLYPDTLHVPLVLAWPGATGGERSSQPVRLIDLGRTLLDLAGLEHVAFPGADLRSGDGRDARFAVATGRRSASVTRAGWHLIQHLRDDHRVELYHLGSDPACERDRVDEERERAGDLRAVLLEWLRHARAGWAGGRHSDAATLERLAELGYADQLGDDEAEESSATLAGCPCEWCEPFR
jgi:arylsulfatase A-like enzyme